MTTPWLSVSILLTSSGWQTHLTYRWGDWCGRRPACSRPPEPACVDDKATRQPEDRHEAQAAQAPRPRTQTDQRHVTGDRRHLDRGGEGAERTSRVGTGPADGCNPAAVSPAPPQSNGAAKQALFYRG